MEALSELKLSDKTMIELKVMSIKLHMLGGGL